MASKYGVNATKRDNQAIKQLPEQGEAAGRLRVAYDSYELAAVLSTSDTLYMMKLPAGARVIDAILRTDDLTSGALGVGYQANGSDAADLTAFLSAVDVAGANVATMSGVTGGSTGLFKQLAAETQVVITPSTSTGATTGTIELVILYVVD